jgi:hypothetical protein
MVILDVPQLKVVLDPVPVQLPLTVIVLLPRLIVFTVTAENTNVPQTIV